MSQSNHGPNLTEEQIRNQNDRYRGEEPSDLHKEAMATVLRGNELSDEMVEKLVDRLYEPFSDDTKDLPVDPFEPTLTREEGNGLGSAVVRNRYSVDLHISEKLYSQQPIGVLLRPINDNVRKKGEAVITDTTPRSDDVVPEIMPARHFKLRIEPMPLWMEKWVGEDGYAPMQVPDIGEW